MLEGVVTDGHFDDVGVERDGVLRGMKNHFSPGIKAVEIGRLYRGAEWEERGM
jgi:hypothetical protein